MVADVMSVSPKEQSQWNRIRPVIQNHTKLDICLDELNDPVKNKDYLS